MTDQNRIFNIGTTVAVYRGPRATTRFDSVANIYKNGNFTLKNTKGVQFRQCGSATGKRDGLHRTCCTPVTPEQRATMEATQRLQDAVFSAYKRLTELGVLLFDGKVHVTDGELKTVHRAIAILENVVPGGKGAPR